MSDFYDHDLNELEDLTLAQFGVGVETPLIA